MNDEDKIKIHVDLIDKIVNTEINGHKLIVAGGAATDILYNLVPNDIDIFLPRSCIRYLSENMGTILRDWGVWGTRGEDLAIRVLESQYGECTLVYEVIGEYQGIFIKLQFVAVEQGLPQCPIDSCQHFLFRVFGATSSMSAFITDTFNNLWVMVVGCNFSYSTDRKNYIDFIYYKEGSEKLMAKSLNKYLPFLKGKFYQGKLEVYWSYKAVGINKDDPTGTKLVTELSTLRGLMQMREVTGVQTFEHKADT